MTNNPRAVGYVRARVSPSNRLGEDALIAAQMRAIVAECERRGWILDELFVDRGRGARDPTRSGLDGALDVLAAGAHVAMIVASVDRIARRPEDWDDLVRKATAGGWELVVAT